jgi:dihydroxyacetone kinase-like protein
VKKLLNRPEAVADEAIEGLVRAWHDSLRLLEPNVVVRADAPVAGKVGVVSGGGSGHEPMHRGYVGRGMLDAACAGPVFTAPSPGQILTATRRVNGGRGVLFIVKNYTGDVIAFQMAEETAAAEGIAVRCVRVGDDVAVQETAADTGRRGVAGTVLVQKIAGAAAETGRSLEEVAAIAGRAVDSVRSMGIALSGCTVPVVGHPGFELAADELELGIGIHGERGRARIGLMEADEVARLLVESVLADLQVDRGERVLLFVNGMGGTPLMELYVVYRAAARLLEERGISVARSLVGPYVTSLEMAGCSITLMKLDEDLLRLWDAPVSTPAFRWGM